MTRYKVNVQITDEYWVEAQNEEHARRIVAECYSDDSLNTLERGYTDVFVFSEEEMDAGTAEELSTPPTSV